ncbi:MAG: oligosaccharide flippase family protein, partial [Bacteroidales bacterium]|nr:oligosaccharide flippase family protein [Bacteroidales bacterium]
GVLLLVANADYHYALLLPKSEKKAVGVFQADFLWVTGMTLLVALSVFFRKPIAALFNAPELAVFYPLLPLFVLLSGLWTLFNYWFTRNKKFSTIGLYQVSQTASNSLLKYGFGLAGKLRWGLVVSTVSGLALALAGALATGFRHNKAQLRMLFRLDFRQIGTALRRYKRFPIFSLPRSIVNYFSGNLPFFLLTPAFGLGAIGYFGMALTLSFRPINMIVSSIYQVFFQKFSEKVQNRQEIGKLFNRFIVRTLAVVIPCFAVLYFFLPQLCAWLLGDNWAVTGEHIRLLLPWIAMVCVGGSLCFIPDIFQKQSVMLGIEIAYFALRCASLFVGILLHDLSLALLLFSFSGVVVIAVQLIWYRSLITRYEKARS